MTDHRRIDVTDTNLLTQEEQEQRVLSQARAMRTLVEGGWTENFTRGELALVGLLYMYERSEEQFRMARMSTNTELDLRAAARSLLISAQILTQHDWLKTPRTGVCRICRQAEHSLECAVGSVEAAASRLSDTLNDSGNPLA